MGEDVRVTKGPFPPFVDVDEFVIDPKGGWLDARACLEALEARVIAAGAHVKRGLAATAARAGDVALDDGSRLEARAVVVAAGFHAPQLVPGLRPRIRVTRQVELFFDAPLDYPGSPPFAAFEEGFYGSPNVGGAVKIADHRKGPTVTDFEHRPPATVQEIGTARAWLTKRIPALASRPVVRQRVCLYDNTVDDDFLLARVDAAPRRTLLAWSPRRRRDRAAHEDNTSSRGVVVGAGLSGHGFKFAPALGEELACMAGAL